MEGAELETGRRLSASKGQESLRRVEVAPETKALAEYAKMVELLQKGDVEPDALFDHLEKAMQHSYSDALLVKWIELADAFEVDSDQRGKRLLPIVTKYPGQIELVMYYNEQTSWEDSLPVLYKCYDAHGRANGRVLFQIIAGENELGAAPEKRLALLKAARENAKFDSVAMIDAAEIIYTFNRMNALIEEQEELDKQHADAKKNKHDADSKINEDELALQFQKGASNLKRSSSIEDELEALAQRLGDLLTGLDAAGLDTAASVCVCAVLENNEQWDVMLDFLNKVQSARKWQRPEDWWIVNRMAVSMHLKDWDVAIGILEKLGRFEDWSTEVQTSAVDVYMNKSTASSVGRALEIQKCVVRKAHDTASWLKLGLLFSLLDKRKEARVALLGVDTDELNANGYLQYITIHELLGDKKEAFGMLQALADGKLTLDDGEEMPVWFFQKYAAYCWDSNDLARTEKTYKDGLAAYPDDEALCNGYAYLLAEQNRKLDLAEQLVKKALATQPDMIAFIDTLAWIYYRQGNIDEAMGEMKKIAKLVSKDVLKMEKEIWEHFLVIQKAFEAKHKADKK